MYLVRFQPVLAQGLQGRLVPQLPLLLVEEAKSLSAVVVLDEKCKLASEEIGVTHDALLRGAAEVGQGGLAGRG